MEEWKTKSNFFSAKVILPFLSWILPPFDELRIDFLEAGVDLAEDFGEEPGVEPVTKTQTQDQPKR